ncbi:MAG: twin-arginine translocase TatA/TatE family subunit [Candidatus Krumholzibacteriota bacterium]|nr:twin-arginine translocase TatA/TatE family subunit [Candidatus Krumholzibacteriota bacterium]
MSLLSIFSGYRPEFLLIGPLGWSELLIILVIVLIFFGPRRLPEVAEAIGKSLQKFKKASRDVKNEIESEKMKISEDDDKKG